MTHDPDDTVPCECECCTAWAAEFEALSAIFTDCMAAILAGLGTLDGSAKYKAVDVALDAIQQHVEWIERDVA